MNKIVKNRFVIFCWARTGSYLLTDILDKQEGVTCHGEVFKKNRVELKKIYRDQMNILQKDVAKRDTAPLKFLEDLFSISSGSWVGFKMFPTHNQEVLSKLMYDKCVKKILLARNPIQTYISTLVAVKSGVWIKTKASKEVNNVQVKVSIDELLRRVIGQRNFFEHVLAAAKLTPGNSFMLLDYSELKDPDKMRALSNYLGMNSWQADVTPRYFKQIVRPYPEIVTNWDVVQKFCNHLGVDEKITFLEFMKSYNSSLYSEPKKSFLKKLIS